ncbi:MAG: hypothetical protein G01um101444_101 [Parcubacteria group bacterium Gr01-1014_44]|nr:MAG: hypothetical protein G01um101444_101 [Parcubacteria group bacterium Gr01-1014_44]
MESVFFGLVVFIAYMLVMISWKLSKIHESLEKMANDDEE